MGRVNIDTDDYNRLNIDHNRTEACDGGRTLYDSCGDPIGNIYYEDTVTQALQDGTLEFEESN